MKHFLNYLKYLIIRASQTYGSFLSHFVCLHSLNFCLCFVSYFIFGIVLQTISGINTSVLSAHISQVFNAITADCLKCVTEIFWMFLWSSVILCKIIFLFIFYLVLRNLILHSSRTTI